MTKTRGATTCSSNEESDNDYCSDDNNEDDDDDMVVGAFYHQRDGLGGHNPVRRVLGGMLNPYGLRPAK